MLFRNQGVMILRTRRPYRLALLALVLGAAAAISASQAFANHIVCQNRYSAAHPATSWLWLNSLNNGYNYTDWSEWTGSDYAITGRRIDSAGSVTYSAQDTSQPYYLFFDNGSTSPWRKSGMFNQGAYSQETYFEQGNDNGSCN